MNWPDYALLGTLSTFITVFTYNVLITPPYSPMQIIGWITFAFFLTGTVLLWLSVILSILGSAILSILGFYENSPVSSGSNPKKPQKEKQKQN